jgi:exonuclease III
LVNTAEGVTNGGPPSWQSHARVSDYTDGTLAATRKQNVRYGLTAAFVRAGHFHKKLGLQLDAFPLSPPLAERLESCRIDRDFRKGPKPSDHAPLLAELRD